MSSKMLNREDEEKTLKCVVSFFFHDSESVYQYLKLLQQRSILLASLRAVSMGAFNAFFFSILQDDC